MFRRNKRDRILVLCSGERRLVTTAMLSFRNKLAARGKPTEDISELLNAFRDGEDIIVKTDKMAARQYRPRQDETLFEEPFGEDEAEEEEEAFPPQHELLFE